MVENGIKSVLEVIITQKLTFLGENAEKGKLFYDKVEIFRFSSAGLLLKIKISKNDQEIFILEENAFSKKFLELYFSYK